MGYETLIALHLLGMVLFTGNALVGGWWKSGAERSGDRRVAEFALARQASADYLFGLPGLLLLLLTGEFLSAAYFKGDSPGWVHLGRGLFLAAGLVWLAGLVPLRRAQTAALRGSQALDGRFRSLGRYWNLLAVLLVVLPLANLFVMVFKPV